MFTNVTIVEKKSCSIRLRKYDTFITLPFCPQESNINFILFLLLTIKKNPSTIIRFFNYKATVQKKLDFPSSLCFIGSLSSIVFLTPTFPLGTVSNA